MQIAHVTTINAPVLSVIALQQENSPVICNAALSPHDLARQMDDHLEKADGKVQVVLVPDAKNRLLPQIEVMRRNGDRIALSCDPITGYLQNESADSKACTMEEALTTVQRTVTDCYNNGLELKTLRLNVSDVADQQNSGEIALDTVLHAQVTPSQASRLKKHLSIARECLTIF